ncbi:8-oxo-dGTP diphosphatase [Nakamurella sp. UYEF19]|uniref:NUDIX hydrolase n=1 Tax=Nakamurella sp. UYEF19 TaxID=1756392 RepID=UPI00339ABD23
MRNDLPLVKAAGAVLWRPSRKHGIRVALVHRPRYDDWSLPKGKADAGETMPMTASREVQEETGFRSVLGRALTTVSYSVGGGAKTVEYFAARRTTGAFVPNKEVDRLEWLSLSAARAKMTYDFDKAVLDTFSLERPDLTGVLLVRHARAGHRESFEGNDTDRPLDAKGRKQAQALVSHLMPFGPGSVHSAPVERCLATVAPLARALGVTVEMEPLLAEDAYRDDPAGARRRLVELATAQSIPPTGSSAPVASSGILVAGRPGGAGPPAAGPRSGKDGGVAPFTGGGSPLTGAAVAETVLGTSGAVVTCSQGGVIPGVVKSLAGRSDVVVPRTGTPKGAYWFLSFDGRRLVQADPYPSPVI